VRRSGLRSARTPRLAPGWCVHALPSAGLMRGASLRLARRWLGAGAGQGGGTPVLHHARPHPPDLDLGTALFMAWVSRRRYARLGTCQRMSTRMPPEFVIAANLSRSARPDALGTRRADAMFLSVACAPHCPPRTGPCARLPSWKPTPHALRCSEAGPSSVVDHCDPGDRLCPHCCECRSREPYFGLHHCIDPAAICVKPLTRQNALRLTEEGDNALIQVLP
jgi:hypothetical protein